MFCSYKLSGYIKSLAVIVLIILGLSPVHMASAQQLISNPNVVFKISHTSIDWQEAPRAPFDIIAFTGSIEKGLVVFGGRSKQQAALVTDIGAGYYRTLANTPFRVAGCSGDNIKGPIVFGGTDYRTVAVMRNYEKNQWVQVARAPFIIKDIAGDNGYGPIIVGGPNERKAAYMRDYTRNEWMIVADAPFTISVVAGDNYKGMIIAGGYNNQQVAVMRNYQKNEWQVLANAPFRVTDIAGTNLYGPIIIGGRGNRQVAYMDNYSQNSWKIGGDLPIQGMKIAGTNDNGIIVCGTGSFQPAPVASTLISPATRRSARVNLPELSGDWVREATITNRGTVQRLKNDSDLRFSKEDDGNYQLKYINDSPTIRNTFTVQASKENNAVVLHIDHRASNGYSAKINLVVNNDQELVGRWSDSRGNEGDYRLIRKGTSVAVPGTNRGGGLPDISGDWIREATITNASSTQRLENREMRLTHGANGKYNLKYINKKEEVPSVFSVQYGLRKNTPVVQIQQKATNGYTSNIALIVKNLNEMSGKWKDSRGNTGDYRMTRKTGQAATTSAAASVSGGGSSYSSELISGDWTLLFAIGGRGAGPDTQYHFTPDGKVVSYWMDYKTKMDEAEVATWKLEGDRLTIQFEGYQSVWIRENSESYRSENPAVPNQNVYDHLKKNK